MKENLKRFKILVISLLILTKFGVEAQTVALSDDPDFIKASLLIASPGFEPHEISGHAFIRLECPTHNLDRIFSFGNDAENWMKVFFEGAKGKYYEFQYQGYVDNNYKKAGREVISYPLNLTLNEKARLWEVLDSLKTLPEKPFDIIDSHCFSEIMKSVDIALKPSGIDWSGYSLEKNSYFENTYLLENETSPWNVSFIIMPLGNLADKSGEGRTFVYPFYMPRIYKELQIVRADGSRRPLFSGEPEVLVPLGEESLERPVRPTPTEAALIVLGVVIAVCSLQLAFRWKWPGFALDTLLWILVTAGGLFIALVTYMPGHVGGSWNWPLVVLNPLAWIPILIWRREARKLRVVWAVYAAVLLLFAAAIPLVAPSMVAAWRILALALAIRCAYQYYTNSRY